jgi:hypothetical protein
MEVALPLDMATPPQVFHDPDPFSGRATQSSAYRWDVVSDPSRTGQLGNMLQTMYRSSIYFPLVVRSVLDDALTPSQAQMDIEQYPAAVELTHMEYVMNGIARHISAVSDQFAQRDPRIIIELESWGKAYLPDVRSCYLELGKLLRQEKSLVRQFMREVELRESIAAPLGSRDVEVHDVDEERGAKKNRQQLYQEGDVALPLDEAAGVSTYRQDPPADLFEPKPRVTFGDPLDVGRDRLYGERFDPTYGLNADGTVRPMDESGGFVMEPDHRQQQQQQQQNEEQPDYEQRRSKLAEEQRTIKAQIAADATAVPRDVGVDDPRSHEEAINGSRPTVPNPAAATTTAPVTTDKPKPTPTFGVKKTAAPKGAVTKKKADS